MTTITKSTGFNVESGISEIVKEKLRDVLSRANEEFTNQDISGLTVREYKDVSFSEELEEEIRSGRFSGNYLTLALLNVGNGRVSRGVGGCYEVYSYYGEICEIEIVDACKGLFNRFENSVGDKLDDRTFYILSEIASADFDGYETKDYFFDYVFEVYESFEFVTPKYRTVDRVVIKNGVERTVSVVEKIVVEPVEVETIPNRNWRLYMPKELAS